ncbi:MAG: GTPase [Thermofilaceae archaeon]|nr:GTPase [Thermofilaceae archaeon]
MPANLPPQAKAKWKKVIEAKTKQEKLQALTEFLSEVPKHKGTEKLVMQVRRQIARLKEEIELEKSRKKGGGGTSPFIEKEGDIQVVLLGLSNTGKSTIFKAFTGLEALCSEAPFETTRPQPGMFNWEGVEIQLIDTPSLVQSESSSRNSQILALAFNADALALVVDATRDMTSQLSYIESMLRAKGITIREEKKRVIIEKRSSGGVNLIGGRLKPSEVANLLRDYGIYHALVWLTDDATLDDIEAAVLEMTAFKPAIIIVTKAEAAPEALDEAEPYLSKFKTLVFDSSKVEIVKNEIGKYLFQTLELIRIYTKNPKNGEISARPLVVRKGARVEEVARRIHSRLYKDFKYALIWNDRRLKFSPVRVGRDFELDDLDVIEIVA